MRFTELLVTRWGFYVVVGGYHEGLGKGGGRSWAGQAS